MSEESISEEWPWPDWMNKAPTLAYRLAELREEEGIQNFTNTVIKQKDEESSNA